MKTAFQQTLLQGSWRGVPFFTEENDGEIGRRGMVHEYWGRDTPYAEDGGKRARRIYFRCFVLGDDCADQRDRLLGALEQQGPGMLVHPSMGSAMMQPDPIRPCRFHETWAENRRINFELAFVEAGELNFPVAGEDTQAASAAAGGELHTASGGDFTSAAESADNNQTVTAQDGTIFDIGGRPGQALLQSNAQASAGLGAGLAGLQ